MHALKSKLSLSVKIPINSMEHLDNRKKTFNKSECSLIANEIYISDYQYSVNYEFLKMNKFTHIINCAGGSKRFTTHKYDDFEYLVLDIKDDPNFNLENSAKEVIKFIEKADALCPNRKILIHCFEGISRAPALLITYLMWKNNFDKETAMLIVKEKRPFIEINIGFMSQLDNLKNCFNTFSQDLSM
jgi:predicted protein tyrosine phosphatase